jgi:hypothetical protein
VLDSDFRIRRIITEIVGMLHGDLQIVPIRLTAVRSNDHLLFPLWAMKTGSK